jgi:hypothetical protein
MSDGGERARGEGQAPGAQNDEATTHDATATPDAPASPDAPERKRRRWPGGIELFVAIMLGLTAVASAYAAWRNEQRNHDATAQFSEGIRDYDDGGQFYAEGQSVLSRDESLFLEYAKAKQLSQGTLATYIFDNLMSPTLQAGVRWWEGPNTRTSHPARNPFSPHDPDYRIQQLADANKSYGTSRNRFTEARAEQEKADHYTLIEVILATSLFLYGVAGVTASPRSKRAIILIGTVIFVIALVFLVTG